MQPESTQEISERHQDEAVSIAVISTQVSALKELMLEKLSKQDVVLTNIEKQTVKTNGHVADAFIKIADVEKDKDIFQNKIKGALLISNIIIVPILLWLVFKHLQA